MKAMQKMASSFMSKRRASKELRPSEQSQRPRTWRTSKLSREESPAGRLQRDGVEESRTSASSDDWSACGECDGPQMVQVAKSPIASPACYALSDEEYTKWKHALMACKRTPDSAVKPLQALATNRKLLNWRSAVSGQTLLHELVVSGASPETLKAAVDLGCECSQLNAVGETPAMIASRKGRHSAASVVAAPCMESYSPRTEPSSRASRGAYRGSRSSRNAYRGGRPESVFLPPPPLAAPSPGAQGPLSYTSVSGASREDVPKLRKRGFALRQNETKSLPQAKLNLDFDFAENDELDQMQLQLAIQKEYGEEARVQIDEVYDADLRGDAKSSALATKAGKARVQKVKCRVMWDNASKAREDQMRVASSAVVQQSIAMSMQMNERALDFDAAAQKLDEVDAITLKLDSDSSHILCGACLLYNERNECEQVVHYNDRSFWGGAIQHSGDTQVDGKSVHTIGLVLSKLPDEVSQLYFTLCSCGPSDLSHFKNPSIMLYENGQPDANLLEYSIEQAAQSVSCVMARMLRQPLWSGGDQAVIAHILRRLKLPLLCVDLCMTMSAENTWSIQALGTNEWHLKENICCNYHYSKDLIESKMKTDSSVSSASGARTIGGRR